MKVGMSYWTLILRSQTHHAIMFGDKQGFVRLYSESSGEAVQALIRPDGKKAGDDVFGEELEADKVGHEVVMTEFESAIFHLLEKLRPTDSGGDTEREMLLDWIAALQVGCMELDFIGQTHSVAFRILESLVNCRVVKFEVLSDVLRDVDVQGRYYEGFHSRR